jgi:hypothetical protein
MNVDVVVGSLEIITSSLKKLGPVRMVTASAISFPALFKAFRFNSRSVKPILINVSILSSIFDKSVDVEDETIEHEIFSIDDDEDAVDELLENTNIFSRYQTKKKNKIIKSTLQHNFYCRFEYNNVLENDY